MTRGNIVPAAVALAAAIAIPPLAHGETPASGAYVCDDWTGRHSNDPEVDWRNVSKVDAVVLTFDAQNQPVVSFPNDAFPGGVYPAADTEHKSMTLRTPDRPVYQAVSKSMIDTITFEGLRDSTVRAVRQRFRFDKTGPQSIAFRVRATNRAWRHCGFSPAIHSRISATPFWSTVERLSSGMRTPGSVDCMRWTMIEASGWPGSMT